MPGWDRRVDTNGKLVPIEMKEVDGSDKWELYNVGGGNKWDVFWGITEHEGLGELISIDNFQYLDIRRYQDDGWNSDARFTQTIDVNPDVKYSISFIYAVPQQNTKKGEAAASRTVSVYDVADQTNPLYQFVVGEEVTYLEWTKIAGEFTTPASCTQIQLKVGLRGSWKESTGKNDVVALNVDNMVITKANGGSINDDIKDNIDVNVVGGEIEITGANSGDKLSVVNLMGQEVLQTVITSDNYVTSSQLLKGAYVVKIGNATRKIIL